MPGQLSWLAVEGMTLTRNLLNRSPGVCWIDLVNAYMPLKSGPLIARHQKRRAWEGPPGKVFDALQLGRRGSSTWGGLCEPPKVQLGDSDFVTLRCVNLSDLPRTHWQLKRQFPWTPGSTSGNVDPRPHSEPFAILLVATGFPWSPTAASLDSRCYCRTSAATTQARRSE